MHRQEGLYHEAKWILKDNLCAYAACKPSGSPVDIFASTETPGVGELTCMKWILRTEGARFKTSLYCFLAVWSCRPPFTAPSFTKADFFTCLCWTSIRGLNTQHMFPLV